MSDLISVAEQALEFIKDLPPSSRGIRVAMMLDEAIAEAEKQKPVAFITNKRQRINVEIKPDAFVWMPTTTDWEIPLYTNPQPKREPLTDEKIQEIWEKAMFVNNGKHAVLNNQPFVHFARAIEAKLKEKNT